ncbi:unnamed protein product [Effrenium voratum]|nr:unnamed protein product [Effrenium voratum]
MRQTPAHWRAALEARCVQASIVPVNQALSVLAKCSHWRLLLLQLQPDRLGRCRLAPDLVSYNSGLAAFARAGAWLQAAELLAAFAARGARANAISRSSAASAGGEWQAALLHLGLISDIVACSTAMTVCKGQWRLPRLLLSLAPACRLIPNVVALTTAVDALRRGAWLSSVFLLKGLSGIQLDEAAFTATVSSCGPHWKAAVSLFWWGRRQLGSVWLVGGQPTQRRGGRLCPGQRLGAVHRRAHSSPAPALAHGAGRLQLRHGGL